LYDANNDANPTISLGSSATNRLEIKSTYNSGTQTLCDVNFSTYTSSVTTNDGRFIFEVDDVEVLKLLDSTLVAAGDINCTNGAFSAMNTTTSSATEGGLLKLQSNDGAVMGDNHRLGVIEFKGAEDTSSTMSIGARIQAIARDAWDGSNNDADLEFYTTDGTTESKALTLDADNLATFAGAVTVTGALTCTTDLATDQQKHLAYFDFKGFGTHDGSNYEIPELMSDNKAPFDHDTSVGSDGLTATAVTVLLRAGGHVMPRAGTLKRFTGWAGASGSGTTHVALFKYTPVADDATADSLVLLENYSFTAVGAGNLVLFNETSFNNADIAAGDIIISALKGVNNKTTYFTSTLEVEWD